MFNKDKIMGNFAINLFLYFLSLLIFHGIQPTTQQQPETCVISWTKMKDRNVYGLLELDSKIDTEEKCKEECINRGSCTMCDFSTKTSRCYIGMEDTELIYHTTDVNHFILTRICSGSEYKKWKLKGNYEVKGKIVDMETEKDLKFHCAEACEKDEDCSYFFILKNNDCYIYSKSEPPKYTENPDSLLYEKTELSRKEIGGIEHCEPKWEEYTIEKEETLISTYQNDTLSLTDCQQICFVAPLCEAIGFAKDNGSCLLVYDIIKNASSGAAEQEDGSEKNTSYYKLTRDCEFYDGCKNNWTVKNNTNSFGLTAISGKFTVETCKELCIKQENCSVVNFNAKTYSCWTGNSSKASYKLTGVDQFELKRNCTPEACPAWKEEKSKSFSESTEIPDVATLEACRTLCISVNNYCYGISFNSDDKKCMIGTSDQLSDSEVTTPYNISNRYCINSKKDKEKCSVWQHYKNAQIYGLEENDKVTTLNECKLTCAKDKDCKSLNFNFSEKKCLTGSITELIQNTTVIDTYILSRDCINKGSDNV